jgi:diaminopimelate decarboxylase
VNQAIQGFEYKGGILHAGTIPVSAIADAVGTPTYIYSADGIRASYRRLEKAFSALRAQPHYAVKACSSLQICRLLHELGASMDVVSGGELERAWLAGASMSEITFAGVGKTSDEVRAALDGRFSPMLGKAERFGRSDLESRGPVGMFNIESVSELERLQKIAGELGIVARACIRVNPNVDPHTHEYTTTGKDKNKFGIDAHLVPGVFRDFSGHPIIDLVGLHVHIGSPVRRVAPYVEAVQVLLQLIGELESAGHQISLIDLGGGWAVDYVAGESPGIEAYAEALTPLLEERVRAGTKVVLEPGRSITANAGILLTRVQHVKEGSVRRFVICDAGMHTMIRPALYQAFHFIWPARVAPEQVPAELAERPDLPDLRDSEVVGPICETADFLARNRPLPSSIEQDDLLVVFSAGSYGMSMTSNYNDHGRPAEVLVDGDKAILINERQTLDTLFETERKPRELTLRF